MSRKYVFKKKDDWSNPVGLLRMMTVARNKIKVGAGPFTITENGDPVVKDAPRRKTLRRLRRFLQKRDVGSTYRVRDKEDICLAARAVIVKDSIPTTDSTNGNAKADRYWNWVRAEYSQFNPSFGGAYVCKDIAGSSTLSQHSYGNAVDVFFDSAAHQDTVADAVVATQELDPYHVITHARIWTKGQGWHSYGGEYHSHLHVDFDPQYSGACGVRG